MAPASPARLRFEFECPLQWELLATTDDPNVRRCVACNHDVYLCQTEAEFRDRARAGDCVAAPTPLVKAMSGLGQITIGRPAELASFSDTVFGADGEP